KLREVVGARGACLDVRSDHLALLVLERAERVGREVFGRVSFLGHRSSSRLSRSLFIASRTRLFTVPSGVAVRAPVSLCDEPPQDAGARPSRCPGGSFPPPPPTRSARR